MRWSTLSPRGRHLLIAAVTLLAGVVVAAVIYARAIETPPIPMEFSPKNSKQYRHDLEVFGGKANVLAAQFMDWFNGLWHGRSLAYTVFVITVFAALAYLFVTEVAAPLPADEAPADAGGSVHGTPATTEAPPGSAGPHARSEEPPP
jgi:hypothetical protein